jgi:multiple sugar transport system ATP-binding protein
LELSRDNEGIPATVRVVEELGAEAFVYAQLPEHASSAFTHAPDLVVRVDPSAQVTTGDTIRVRVKADTMLLFDAESGVRIAAA